MSERSPARERLLLGLAVLAALAPFLGRAFNIDEPLFLWVAEHVREDPRDFYGFAVNWNGVARPMAEVTKNPPLASYLLAAAGSLAGWSELALHAAFLLPALAAALGTYALARRFCERPLAASLFAVLSPVFVVSATTVMCDVTMLALFVWAIWTWLEGLERRSAGWLALAGLLCGACALTKYFGASLLPLLFVASWIRERRLGAWCAALLVPVAILAAYQLGTRALYGRGLLADAAGYALQAEGGAKPALASSGLIGVVFTGGCFVAALFLAPLFWSRRTLLVGALAFAVASVAFGLDSDRVGPIDLSYPPIAVPWSVKVQMLGAAVAGASVLGLALGDVARRRDWTSALLALWVLGTFVFASFLNWTNNARSILPMAPAVGILIARALERRSGGTGSARRIVPLIAFLPAVAIALAAAWADATWADAVRDDVRGILAKHSSPARPAWFEGHWGFQYYMQEGGAKPVDFARDVMRKGDVIVVPIDNVDRSLAPASVAVEVERPRSEQPRWIRTISWELRAGFYSSLFGPLPYGFGRAAADEYRIYRVERDFRFADPSGQGARPPESK